MHCDPVLANTTALLLFFSCFSAICTLACQNGGTCSAPDTCICASGWTGQSCEEGIYGQTLHVYLNSWLALYLLLDQDTLQCAFVRMLGDEESAQVARSCYVSV